MPKYVTERKCKVTKYLCLVCEKKNIQSELVFTGIATRADLDDLVKGCLSFEHKCEQCQSLDQLPEIYPIVELLEEERPFIKLLH